MLLRSLATFFHMFCVIFLMCPKRTRLSIVLSNLPVYYPTIKESGNVNKIEKLRNRSNFQSRLSSGITYDSSVDEDNRYEPGFDFNEDEMKKLKLWNNGTIPYYLDVPSFADKVLRDRIRSFLNKVNLETSLNFVELLRPPTEYDNQRWIFFINRRGLLNCSDHSIRNFTNTGVQRVVLGYDCISNDGGLADAVLAIAGVPPQHNAPNRNDYIEVIEENIKPEKLYLFQKFKDTEWLFHDLVYDFKSAGHIDYYKYSSNGRATFRTKVPYKNSNIGDTFGFSSNDILKIRMLYNYITKKSQDKVQKCNNLLTTGIKSKSVVFNIKNNIKVRPKPTKYLGIESEDNTGHSNSETDDNGEINSKSDIDKSNVDQEKGSSNINKYDNEGFGGQKGNRNKCVNISNNINREDFTYEVKEDRNSENNGYNCEDLEDNKSSYNHSIEDNRELIWKSNSSKSDESKEGEITDSDSRNNEDLTDGGNCQSISIQNDSSAKFTSVRHKKYKKILIIPIKTQPLKLNTDPLTYLSDYETEENIPKRIVWKKSGQPNIKELIEEYSK